MRILRVNPKTGLTQLITPAGGTGGGLTSFLEEDVSEAEHVAHLKRLSDDAVQASDGAKKTYEDAVAKAKENKDKKAKEEAAHKPVEIKTEPKPAFGPSFMAPAPEAPRVNP